MTLQASGQISLQDLEDEMVLGLTELQLSDYYDVTFGTPTSGEIQLSDFYGKTRPHIITQGSYVFGSGDTSFGFALAHADHSLDAHGSINRALLGASNIIVCTWLEYDHTDSRFMFSLDTQNGQEADFASIETSLGTFLSNDVFGYFEDASGNLSTWYWLVTPGGDWDGTGTTRVVIT